MTPRPIPATLLVVLALTACASVPPSGNPDAPDTGEQGATQPPGAPKSDGTLTIGDDVAGPAVQVADALASDGRPVRVAGALFVDADGTVLLCSAIAESFPPQCGGDRLRVVGLDLEALDGLEQANGVRWAEGVELSGTVD